MIQNFSRSLTDGVDTMLDSFVGAMGSLDKESNQTFFIHEKETFIMKSARVNFVSDVTLGRLSSFEITEPNSFARSFKELSKHISDAVDELKDIIPHDVIENLRFYNPNVSPDANMLVKLLSSLSGRVFANL